MSFMTTVDTSDGSVPSDIEEVADLTKDELLEGIASGSNEHLVEWMRRRDIKNQEKAEG